LPRFRSVISALTSELRGPRFRRTSVPFASGTGTLTTLPKRRPLGAGRWAEPGLRPQAYLIICCSNRLLAADLCGDLADESCSVYYWLSPSHLTRMHDSGMLMHMRTTLNIDDSLLRDAAKLTGVKEKTSLVRLGLEALIAKESARRLANLGGTEKQLRGIPRRRPRRVA
jgi:Arc/MetJ family transcription regulator